MEQEAKPQEQLQDEPAQVDATEALISDCDSNVHIDDARSEESKQEKSLVQGTQGDFKQENSSQASQMSVFNQFQRELQKIGRPNVATTSNNTNYNNDSSMQQQVKEVSHEEVKVQLDEDDHEEEEASPQESEDEDEMEQSVVYSSGGNIYDQPHRAVYGIKKAKNMF